jgi:micrococcal nuclease
MFGLMQRLATALATATVIFLAGACAPPTAGPAPPAGTVVRVIDGDTLVIKSGEADVTVRLLGIDTPEVAHHGNLDECGGPEAAVRLKEMLPPGTSVQMARDSEARDAYGRLLAYVIRSADGVVVNLQLAVEGHAHPLMIAPNRALADDIATAASAARRSGLGLWASCLQ